jgi:hypothetical protein
MVDVLARRWPQLPSAPQRAAAVVFLGGDTGTLARVEGVEQARAIPGVEDVDVTVSPGQSLVPWRSSWDRAGSILTSAVDADAAAAAALTALDTVRLVTSDARG